MLFLFFIFHPVSPLNDLLHLSTIPLQIGRGKRKAFFLLAAVSTFFLLPCSLLFPPFTQTCVVETTAGNLLQQSSINMMLKSLTWWLSVQKQLSAPSFWLSHPKPDWLMWKVCAEPTTSAGVGLWNSNSHEERPTSPVAPNPAAAAHSLFLILLFRSVHHLRMLRSKASQKETRWQERWWEGG